MTSLNSPWHTFTAEDQDLIFQFLNSDGSGIENPIRGKALKLQASVTELVVTDDSSYPTAYGLILSLKSKGVLATRFPNAGILWTFNFTNQPPIPDYVRGLNGGLSALGYYRCPSPTYDWVDRSLVPIGATAGEHLEPNAKLIITEWREFPASPDYPEPYGCMRCPEWFRCTIAGKVISVGDEIA